MKISAKSPELTNSQQSSNTPKFIKKKLPLIDELTPNLDLETSKPADKKESVLNVSKDSS